MKSVIDWNEIVPKLNKGLRDSLMLEAVVMLSEQGYRNTPSMPRGNGQYRVKRAPRERVASTPGRGINRQWLVQGDGQMLSAPGRHYRVLKDAKNPPSRGKIGGVWAKLIESKNSIIAYEGLCAICKGQKATPSATIAQLWERGFIDLAKIAVAS